MSQNSLSNIDLKLRLIIYLYQSRVLRDRALGKEAGFTIVELLTVVLILGILASIAIPSFLNQAAKAQQANAKNYVGSINRAQQAYYMEHYQFAPSLRHLAVQIEDQTSYYEYLIENSSTTETYTLAHGVSRRAQLRSYVGIVALVMTETTLNQTATPSLICETNQAQIGRAADPSYSEAKVSCAATTRMIAQ